MIEKGWKDENKDIMLTEEINYRSILASRVRINNKESFLIGLAKLLANFVDMKNKYCFYPCMPDFIEYPAMTLYCKAIEVSNFGVEMRKIFERKNGKRVDI